MTQTLEEVALAFCREILGWKRPEPSGRPCVELMDLSEPVARYFSFNDLSVVSRAVQSWLTEGRYLTLTVFDVGFLAMVHSAQGILLVSVGPTSYACHAILSACVAAQRKIKGEVQDDAVR